MDHKNTGTVTVYTSKESDTNTSRTGDVDAPSPTSIESEPIGDGTINTEEQFLAPVKLEPIGDGTVDSEAPVKSEPIGHGTVDTEAPVKSEPIGDGTVDTEAPVKSDPTSTEDTDTTAPSLKESGQRGDCTGDIDSISRSSLISTSNLLQFSAGTTIVASPVPLWRDKKFWIQIGIVGAMQLYVFVHTF